MEAAVYIDLCSESSDSASSVSTVSDSTASDNPGRPLTWEECELHAHDESLSKRVPSQEVVSEEVVISSGSSDSYDSERSYDSDVEEPSDPHRSDPGSRQPPDGSESIESDSHPVDFDAEGAGLGAKGGERVPQLGDTDSKESTRRTTLTPLPAEKGQKLESQPIAVAESPLPTPAMTPTTTQTSVSTQNTRTKPKPKHNFLKGRIVLPGGPKRSRVGLSKKRKVAPLHTYLQRLQGPGGT